MAFDTRTTVLIADDHQLLRMGLAQMLSSTDGFRVVAECATGAEVAPLLVLHDPDVLVLDLQLKDGSSQELIPQFVATHPDLAILVLSMHDQRVYAERCLRLGAKGYLMKEEAAALVVAAIRQIAAGGIFLSPSLGDAPPEGLRIATLSDRELQIFELTGDGLPTRAIAERLELSAKTVEAHKANIKRKLGVEFGVELVRLAMAWRGTGGR
jgi:DNA-binding NarL/FixJ family response regulator